ncbi:MAG: carbamoyltransferase C-terminal domain-containing protein [Chitinophagales bacterium]|nr:carbamoyltransferase C-terminal domain-containing protein [Chitinophagales bacterium]
MVVLGINGGFRLGYQDVSACLVIDGKVIFAIEEERLSRIKFSAGKLPFLSFKEALDFGQLKIQDIDCIGFHGSTWEPEIEDRIKSYFINHFGYAPPIHRYHHHDCHSLSAYYASGFDDALVVTLDNSGDGISTQISEVRNGKLKLLERFARPNSYGTFYSLITQYCGFVKDSDEYKLMGLAPYGDKTKFDFDWLLDFQNGELKLNTEYIVSIGAKAPSPHRDEMIFNQKFLDKIGSPRRLPKSDYAQFYKDIAASAQRHLEQTALKMLQFYVEKTGLHNVCMGGGVALNCVMNQKIMNADFVDALFVQPASSDAGISLGAAWLAGLEKGITPVKTNNTFLGNGYSNEQIKAALDGCNLKYRETNDPAEVAAGLIAKNKVIGWFQGRMEYGPRALGNRSILANPAVAEMKDLVNQKIKFRDSFRPFCPSILEEDAPKYFVGKQTVSPYMTITYDVRKEMQSKIPAVTHVDGTARIQTVNESQNALYYRLLKNLKEKTGHGVVLNTSFNLSHEPIVCTPRDAIASFYASGLDALVIGNFVIEK